MTEQQGQTTSIKTDVGYYDTASALSIRLNTDSVVRKFELDLKGLREDIIIDKETGDEKIIFVPDGNPLANKLGQQAIMGHLNAVVNHQNVMGNMRVDNKGDEYALYLRRTRRGIAQDLMTNLSRFGIAEDNFAGIMSRMMRLVEMITSRTINDGERRTYAKTTTVQENSSSQTKETGMKIPLISK